MRKMTTVRVDAEILEKAQELGLNISKACETALKHYIRALTNANQQITDTGRSFLSEGSFTKEGSVRPPGFEPGSSAWQADVLIQARLRPLLL